MEKMGNGEESVLKHTVLKANTSMDFNKWFNLPRFVKIEKKKKEKRKKGSHHVPAPEDHLPWSVVP